MSRPPISAYDVPFDDPALKRAIELHNKLSSMSHEDLHEIVHGPFMEWMEHTIRNRSVIKSLPEFAHTASGCFGVKMAEIFEDRPLFVTSEADAKTIAFLQRSFLTGMAFAIALANREIDFSQAIK